MSIHWVEQRGKYGELYFIGRVRSVVGDYPDQQKCLYYFCIDFNDETRANDTWTWSFGMWLTDDWDALLDWKEYKELDNGSCRTLEIAKLACEVVMREHTGDWNIYQKGEF